MDPLTHTLTGLALSRAGLNRLNAYATPILLLAANAPDIDIAALAGGSVSYLHYHRYITHAFFAIPFLAWLPVLVVRLFARKPFDWKWAYLVSVLGVLTHLLMDWTNAYGIRFLLPFSSRWYRLDILSLVDLWIWAVLLIALLAPALARLVSSEIGARPGSGRGWAIVALSFLLLYSCGRFLLHERALATLDSRLYEGAVPVRVAAFPRADSPFRWAGLVETARILLDSRRQPARRVRPHGRTRAIQAGTRTPRGCRRGGGAQDRSFPGLPQFLAIPVLALYTGGSSGGRHPRGRNGSALRGAAASAVRGNSDRGPHRPRGAIRFRLPAAARAVNTLATACAG